MLPKLQCVEISMIYEMFVFQIGIACIFLKLETREEGEHEGPLPKRDETCLGVKF